MLTDRRLALVAYDLVMRILATTTGMMAGLIACATVCVLPWLLGGFIPLARTVLLAGCIAAGLVSMLSHALNGRYANAIPTVVLPLIGLVMLGTWQMRPVSSDPVLQIEHSVLPVALADVPAPHRQATFSPPDTRLVVSGFLALAILGIVCFDHVREPRMMAFAAGVCLINAVVLALIGLSGLFQPSSLEINQEWMLQTRETFATFVNPNNAAGWLCLATALAAGWVAGLFFDPAAESLRAVATPRGKPVTSQLLTSAFQHVAQLTAWKVLAFAAFILLAAAVAATKSRGGILALIATLTVTAMLATGVRRWPFMLLLLTSGALATFGLLKWLQLDGSITAELKTLKDLDKAAGSRPRHWIDSLHSLLDFPATGTGLGSYRFASLPYQTQHTGRWFRYADNSYVDFAVEGGLTGLLLLCAIGVTAFITGTAAWKLARSFVRESAYTSATRAAILKAAGTAVILAVVSQGVSGIFDYGIALPAAAAFLVFLVGATSGCIDASTNDRPQTSGVVRLGAVNTFAVHLCLIGSAASYLPDLIAAAEVDKSVVTGHRLLAHPVTAEDIDQITEQRQLLRQRLRRRPDDPGGLAMMSRLADAEFRWRIMRREHGADIRKQAGFGMLWQRYTPIRLIAQIRLTAETNPIESLRIQALCQRILTDTKLDESLSRVQRRFPLMPDIAEHRAEVAVLQQDDEARQRQQKHALFAEPSNAETYYRLGLLALLTDHRDEAIQLWQQSVKLAAEFRGMILSYANRYWQPDEALRLFGPTDFKECIIAAQECKDATLRTQLLELADALWQKTSAEHVDDIAAGLRAWQLTTLKRTDEAIALLQRQVSQPGDHLSLRRQLARLLETNKEFDRAAAEWNAVLYLQPEDEEAVTALNRLRERRRASASSGH